MDISRKALIATLVINFLLIAIAAVCIFVSKFNMVILWLAVAMIVLVSISSVLLWVYGKEMKK